MDVIEALKLTYANSKAHIAIYDKHMRAIWKNDSELPNTIAVDRVRVPFGEQKTLPLRKDTVWEYDSSAYHVCAMHIHPLMIDDIDPTYYLVQFFTSDVLATLSERSSFSMFKRTIFSSIHEKYAEMLRDLSMLDPYNETESVWEYQTRQRTNLIRSFSLAVNFNELAIYYSGRYSPEFINIGQDLASYFQAIQELMEESGVNYSFSCEPLCYVSVEKERFLIALANILVNAVQYNSKEKKRCILSISKTGNEVVIGVKDNGDGFTDKQIKEALSFNRPVRMGDPQEHLGLLVAKKFARISGGDVNVTSYQSSGSLVEMVLPSPQMDMADSFRSPPPIEEVPAFAPFMVVMSKYFDTVRGYYNKRNGPEYEKNRFC